MSTNASGTTSHARSPPTSSSALPLASQSQAAPEPPPPTTVLPNSQFFSSGSLLFGLAFLIAAIACISCGMLWRRARRRRLGLDRRAVLYDASLGGGARRDLEKPEIWDVFVRRKDEDWTEQQQSWGDVKPLAVQSLPAGYPTRAKLITQQFSANDNNARSLRSPQPNMNLGTALPPAPQSAGPPRRRRLLPSGRTLHNLVLMLPLDTDTEANMNRPSGPATREGEEGGERQLQVAVVIAMPDARGLVKEGAASSSSAEAMMRERKHADEDDLVYELGVAHVPLRMSRMAEGEEERART